MFIESNVAKGRNWNGRPRLGWSLTLPDLYPATEGNHSVMNDKK